MKNLDYFNGKHGPIVRRQSWFTYFLTIMVLIASIPLITVSGSTG